MLEVGGVLRTWALEAEPATTATCLAERLRDHRPLYLCYEGDVPGGRGRVSRWDTGDYVPVQNDDKSLVVELLGERLRGTATLARMSAEDQRWRFSFEPAGTAASGLSAGSTRGEPSGSRGTV